MTAWLLKTEPNEYSFSDFRARGIDVWDGITAPAALKNLRDAKVGDACVIYHTGDERRAMGLGIVVKAAYPDPKKDDPRLVVIDVRAGDRFARSVTLDELKADPLFADSPLVRIGRLSVVPLTREQYESILTRGSTA